MCALLSCALAGMAQSDYEWTSLTLDNAKIKGNKVTDDKRIFLLNVATRQFLTIGGEWGTKIELGSPTIPFWIEKAKGGEYFIFTNRVKPNTYTYLGYRGTKKNDDNNSGVYADNISGDENSLMIFNFIYASGCYRIRGYYPKSSDATGDKKSDNGFYLVAKNIEGKNVIDYVPSKGTTISDEEYGDYAKWMIVGYDQLADYLQKPSDWDKDTESRYEGAEAYNYETNATFMMKDPLISIENVKENLNPYWEGMNYKLGTQTDGSFKDTGKYWHGFITGENAGTGKVTQQITTLQEGWYKLTCDGFFSNKSGKGKAYLIAGGNKKELCAVSADELSRLNIGKALYDGAYSNDLFVYLGTGESTEIGIEVENTSAEDLVTFDNFQLSYFGPKMFLLNEKVGKDGNANKSETGEGRKQPLLLKKSFDIGKWNSFCLPVDLTKKQFYDTFGKDARLAYLAKFKVTDESKFIQFLFKESDGLNDDDIFLEKNTGYLIKVFKEGMLEQDDETTQQMWLIKDAEWTKSDIDIMSEEKFNSENLNADVNHEIQLNCTYYNHTEDDKPIPAGSYELKTGANGYAFYHYNQTHNVEGFRCWIEDHTGSNAKMRFGFNSDDSDNGSTTGISEVNAVNTIEDNKTYNLAGQQVGNNYKGIVISNGKKYVKK